MSATTLRQKIWDRHVVEQKADYDVLYVDMHLIHEVTSAQAFDGLRLNDRPLRRPDLTLGTMDHNVSTLTRSLVGADPLSAEQMETLQKNCEEFGVRLLGIDSRLQGIVHMIGPELGVTQPGMTIVCGDSHTATHGAFGALAFGIGTSEIEHVFATQTITMPKPRDMLVQVDGELQAGINAKDLILHVIGALGVDGAAGHIVEYRGTAIDALTMEERMTVCNMSIEMGARAGLMAPDSTTFAYLEGRKHAPTSDLWDAAVADWRSLISDERATFAKTVRFDAAAVRPTVTWGTTPDMSVSIDGHVPRPEETANPEHTRRALDYMGLDGGEAVRDIRIDRVFIGSCTNGRIEDLREAAAVLRGQHIAPHVQGLVVPGSTPVKLQAEQEGLDEIFIGAGLEWRQAGCSMCLGMNPDILSPGERCASTSNRNFEGRQGRDARTHLLSPAMAAAAAMRGHFVDVSEVLS